MKAYIHYSGGNPWNEECATAERGFENLGIECVPFSTNEELETANRCDVVVAGMLVTGHALALRGLNPPTIDYPESLSGFLGRRVWQCAAGDLSEKDLPVFAKPLNEKELPGLIAYGMEDLAPFLAQGSGYQLICSEVIDIVSEWRVFVRYGEVAGTSCYRGSSRVLPDFDVVENAVSAYVDAPAGYSADFGVTSDGRTVLVEVNDGFALGCYEADSVAYALLLSARWAELVGNEDPLCHLNARGIAVVEGEMLYPPDNKELDELLANVAGATDRFRSVAWTIAGFGMIGDSLVSYLEERERSVKETWGWISAALDLKTHYVEGGSYIFPRAREVRFVIGVSSPDSLGSSSIKRYDHESAYFGGWIDGVEKGKRNELYSLLLEYAEHDAKEFGYSLLFCLMTNDDVEEEAKLASRGYVRASEKDDEHLARGLGAHVIHDFTMEKRLT